MKKVALADCQPGTKVKMRPDTVTLTVQMHVNGQTRLVIGTSTDGGWRDSKELVFLDK